MEVSSLKNKKIGPILLKVLIIEDSEDDTLLIIRKLEKEGYDVVFKRVDTSKEMEKALETEKWDIIISDYTMPHFSGLNALKLLKDKEMDIPFIIVSGNIGEDIAVNAMIEGAHDYIMKDNLSRLVPAINRELKDADVRRKRRKVEKALKKSEKNYRDLVDNALVGVYKTNMDGEILFINESLANLLEYKTVEEARSINIASIYKNSSDREDFITLLKRDGKIEEYEAELLTKNGKMLNVILSAKFDGVYISGMAMDITERKKAENAIKKSLDEKEVLIREIHHRVKNNMQIISSLLSLQSRYIEDKKAFELFRDSQNRVKSMALIHEKLYQSDNLAEIDFKEYIKNLTTDLIRSYGVTPGAISLIINVNKVSLGVNTAIPCGLIINELLTNSIKHAFRVVESMELPDGSFIGRDGKKSRIDIELHQINKDEYKLIFSDNGIGLPENFEFKNIKSLGLRLVNSLTEQLDGKIDLVQENGTKFIITFMKK